MKLMVPSALLDYLTTVLCSGLSGQRKHDSWIIKTVLNYCIILITTVVFAYYYYLIYSNKNVAISTA